MKLVCTTTVKNRNIPNFPNKKPIKSTLALCKHPNSGEYSIILFSGQNKNGTKYNLKANLKQILTRFVNEGKATIQFNDPPHDIYLQADIIQLKGFLHLLRRALENKISDKELTVSSLAVQPVKPKNMALTKLVIRKRSDYPIKGFPRTLEVLQINDIDRCGFDKGILYLSKLRTLDLSGNLIEFLPEELNKLPNLKELNISYNQFGKGNLKQWNWMGGYLSKSLVLLNLSHNDLKFLPDQLVKLHKLTTLNINNNALTTLPSGIGNLPSLKIFSAANNLMDTLPGSIKKWRLQSLDFSNNNFQPCPQNLPSAIFPKPLPVCTLKEYAAKKVLRARIPYPPGVLPLTVIIYLDQAKYCVCGKACFNVYIKHSNMLLLNSISETISTSADEMAYVPIECHFCSLRCFGTAFHNRSRVPVVR